MPPEYCEFNAPAVQADCLKWRAQHHPDLLPEVRARLGVNESETHQAKDPSGPFVLFVFFHP